MKKPDFEYKFYTRFGPGEITFPMKVEDWARRRDDWLGRLVLTFLVPWLFELWVKVKTEQTMSSVDKQAKDLRDQWDSDDSFMVEPTVSVKEDKNNPFGFSEISATYDFTKNDIEVPRGEVPGKENDS